MRQAIEGRIGRARRAQAPGLVRRDRPDRPRTRPRWQRVPGRHHPRARLVSGGTPQLLSKPCRGRSDTRSSEETGVHGHAVSRPDRPDPRGTMSGYAMHRITRRTADLARPRPRRASITQRDNSLIRRSDRRIFPGYGSMPLTGITKFPVASLAPGYASVTIVMGDRPAQPGSLPGITVISPARAARPED